MWNAMERRPCLFLQGDLNSPIPTRPIHRRTTGKKTYGGGWAYNQRVDSRDQRPKTGRDRNASEQERPGQRERVLHRRQGGQTWEQDGKQDAAGKGKPLG